MSELQTEQFEGSEPVVTGKREQSLSADICHPRRSLREKFEGTEPVTLWLLSARAIRAN